MDDDDQNQAFCAECGKKIAGELVETASKGKKAYCENCGTPFRSKIKKKEIGSPKSYEPPPRAEPFKQFIKSKINKQLKYQREIQSKITKKMNDKFDKHFSSVNEPTERAPNRPQPPIAPTPPIRTHTKTNRIIPEKNLKDLKKAINFFNNIVGSPLILILGIIATVGQIVNMFLTWSFLPSTISGTFFRIFVLISLNSYVQKKITPRIYSGDYSKLGIDAIIMGSIGCAIYGLGVFLLVEGILIMVYEILVKVKTLQTHERKTLPVELSYEILASNIIEDVISVMNENLYKAEYFIILLNIFLIINEVSFLSNLTWLFLVFFIVALVMLNFVKTTIYPTLKSTPYAKLEEGFIVKSLILAGFSLAFGSSGIIVLILSIFLFVYRDRFTEIRRKLANYQVGTIPTVTKDQSEIPPATSKKEIPVKSETLDGIKWEAKDTERKKMVPLPSHRVKIQDLDSKKDLQKIPEIQGKKADTQHDPIEKQKSNDKEEKPDKEYLDRLFMVISEETRERLLKLDISEEEKWDIIREFINLPEEQRQKYIEELEDVNRKISEKIISRVNVMKINRKSKEGLMKQLALMTPNNQQDFVEYLESDE